MQQIVISSARSGWEVKRGNIFSFQHLLAGKFSVVMEDCEAMRVTDQTISVRFNDGNIRRCYKNNMRNVVKKAKNYTECRKLIFPDGSILFSKIQDNMAEIKTECEQEECKRECEECKGSFLQEEMQLTPYGVLCINCEDKMFDTCEECGEQFHKCDGRTQDNNVFYCYNHCVKVPECSGKYCDREDGLQLAMGYDRNRCDKKKLIAEQWYCEDCLPQCTTEECKGCNVNHPYTEMEFKEGGIFGEALYIYNDFYCLPCITRLEEAELWNYMCDKKHLGGCYGCDLCVMGCADKDNSNMEREWLNADGKYCYKLHHQWNVSRREGK